MFLQCRPTSRSSGTNTNNNGGVALPIGLADDQAKDFDFAKTEMKYDSTGMFHWSPARNLEDCILVSNHTNGSHSEKDQDNCKKKAPHMTTTEYFVLF